MTTGEKGETMNLATETSGDVEVIEVAMNRMDSITSGDFRREVAPLLLNGGKILLDLEHVEFIDSSGLGAILACLRQVNAAGGELRVCGMSKTVRDIFELVRMQLLIDIHNKREDAIKAFS